MQSTIRSCVPGIAVIVTLAAALIAGCGPVRAEEIQPIARWSGQAGKVGDGDSGYLCGQDALDAFWSTWEIHRPKPEVDFGRQLAVFYMGSGGPHLMGLSLQEGGNLVAVYVQTPTVSRHPNYLILSVPRAGIRSLNGVPVTCPE